MLFIAADHAGFELKEKICHRLADQGVTFEDFGTFSTSPADFPGYANRVAREVVKHNGRGILICGTGQGMAIAANRHKGIRAAVIWNDEVAKRAREEDDANVICLPARIISPELAWSVTSTFLGTTFTHLDRYKRRIKQIDEV